MGKALPCRLRNLNLKTLSSWELSNGNVEYTLQCVVTLYSLSFAASSLFRRGLRPPKSLFATEYHVHVLLLKPPLINHI